jgi:hypothetical protein
MAGPRRSSCGGVAHRHPIRAAIQSINSRCARSCIARHLARAALGPAVDGRRIVARGVAHRLRHPPGLGLVGRRGRGRRLAHALAQLLDRAPAPRRRARLGLRRAGEPGGVRGLGRPGAVAGDAGRPIGGAPPGHGGGIGGGPPCGWASPAAARPPSGRAASASRPPSAVRHRAASGHGLRHPPAAASPAPSAAPCRAASPSGAPGHLAAQHRHHAGVAPQPAASEGGARASGPSRSASDQHDGLDPGDPVACRNCAMPRAQPVVVRHARRARPPVSRSRSACRRTPSCSARRRRCPARGSR